jgi:hypothetical protein
MNTSNDVKEVSIKFPTWKEIASEYSKNELGSDTSDSILAIINSKFELIQNLIESNHPAIALKILADAEGTYIEGKSYESIIKYIENTQIGVNEFQTVYSTKEQKYIHVGNTLPSVIGIEPAEFTIESFLGFSDNNFVHPEDLPHVIRYAGIAYSVLCLPCFTFKVNQDHYKVKFRSLLPKSKIPYIQKQIFSLEKKSFLTIDESQRDLSFPNLHFDFWTVTTDDISDIVTSRFVSDFTQTEQMNCIAFLLNAALLNFPIKYLVLLHERQYTDRNKDVATSVNYQIKENTGLNSIITEQQIGDYFSKTIRKRTGEAFSKWSQSEDSEFPISEPQAIHQAQKLGLLPIPDKIKTLIYSRVGE